MEPIKSFIYYKPIEDKKEKIETALVKDDKNNVQEEKTSPKKDVILTNNEATPKVPQNKPKVQSEQSTALTKVTAPPLIDKQKEPIKKYKSMQSLSRLKDKINKQIINQEIYNHSKPNTGSVMLGTPNYVPHSFVEDTEKKIIDSTDTQVGNGFSVTKNDNGTCTLTEDLSIIGLQGKTTSSFGCGLSKEEKHFKNHMKNVLKKLGK
ncbi:MAG: hypothetical protein ACI9YH_004211 [Colwellia sp.]|jgi:hypothetical protein